jgi:carbon starvation protein
MIIMLIMPAWALHWQLFNENSGWFNPIYDSLTGKTPWAWSTTHLLFAIGMATLGLQIWMVIEGGLLWKRARGVLEEALPPLNPQLKTTATTAITPLTGDPP